MKFLLTAIDPIVIKIGFVILPLPPIGSQQKFRKGDITNRLCKKRVFDTKQKPFLFAYPLNSH